MDEGRLGAARWAGVVAFAALAAGCAVTVEPIGSPDGTAGSSGLTGGAAATGGAATCAPPEPTTSTRTGAERQVRDMTVEEATAWCETYVTQRYPNNHYEPPASPELGFQYPTYIQGYGSTWCWDLVPGGGCVTQPRIDDCVTNLLHAPCEATIVALDDCVDSFFNYDDPAPTCNPVGGGCAPFVSAPHCGETVIMTLSLQPPPDPPDTLYGGLGPQCMLRLAPACD